MWWQWLIFGLIFLAIPFGLFGIKEYTAKKVNPTEEQKKIANQRFTLLCLFYWLCDFFYMTFIVKNLIWRFILGGLIMVVTFCNLSKVFVNGNNKFKFGLIQDFIVGLALTIYLIYIITNQVLQNIIISIVSAVYGGLLTLIGVAWTIRKSDKDRKIEEEQKAKPIFTYNQIFNSPNVKDKIKTCFPMGLEENYFCDVYLEIENSENSYFELMKIYHDSKWFVLENNTIVLPNGKVVLSFRFNNPLNIFLIIKDRLNNIYYYQIEVVTLNHLDKETVHELFTIRNLKPVTKEIIDEIVCVDKGEKNE